jgi:pilus assembly protein CpaB
MRRRLLAALAALVLLFVGTVVLLAYVRSADARALAGVQTTEVLVADQVIPKGTSGDQLTELVRTEVLPQKAALDGRVTDLDELAGLVASVDVQPGEQLLTFRFGEVEAAGVAGTVEVPKGLQEVSILLEPQRAIGGRLKAGDTVGVVISLGDGEDAQTHSVLHKILVTQVQGAPTPVDPNAEATAEEASDSETGSAGNSAPTQSLMVTFAVSAAQAEAVVYGIEHGTLWLSLEPADAKTGGTDVLDAGNIYKKDFA